MEIIPLSFAKELCLLKIYLYLYMQMFLKKDEVHWIGIIILVPCFMKV